MSSVSSDNIDSSSSAEEVLQTPKTIAEDGAISTAHYKDAHFKDAHFKDAQRRILELATNFSEGLIDSILNENRTHVHPTAIVSPRACLGKGVVIGPYSVVGSDVILADRVLISSHVVLDGFTSIGSDTIIFPFASVGTAPQDKKYKGENSRLEIGQHNVIREYVTLQPGTAGGGMLTKIGSGNLFMANCHVGHDCSIGDLNIFANSAALAGHVTISNKVTVGGISAIHQFTKVGELAMLGGGSMVVKDIPPYCIAQGDRACLVGINVVGLQRAGFSEEVISQVKTVFKKLFLSKEGLLADAISSLIDTVSHDSPSFSMLEFVRDSERGVAAVRSKSDS